MTILNLQILTRSVNGLKNIRFFGIFIVTWTDRQWIEVSAIVQNCDKDGRVTDILFLTHDVTDQRERELQQEDALRLALASAEHANKAKTVGSLY